MKNTQTQSIGRRLQNINLLVSSVSSVFVVVLMSTLLYFSLQNSYTKKVDALCALLSDSISAALIFSDSISVDETLKTLHTVPDLEHAYVFDKAGRLFAHYDSLNDTHTPPQVFEPSRYRQGFHFGSLVFHQVVHVTSEIGPVGTIEVQMDLTSAYRQLAFEIGSLVLSALIGFLLIAKFLHVFQRSITQPLSDLTSAMQKVSASGDYSLRAKEVGLTEINLLADTFNQMLSDLSQHEEALQQELHERKRIESQLSFSNNRFETVLKALPDLMFEMDIQGRYIDIWGGKPELLALAKSEMMDRTVSEVLTPEAAHGFLSAIVEASGNGHSNGQQIFLSLPQGERWFELSVARQLNDNSEAERFVVLSRDISDRKQSEEQIEHLAFYDPLTRLPNRRLLMDRLQQALSSSARSGRHGALLFIDLDNFKILNDTLGHAMGDLLLQQVAQQLTSCVRSHDTVARLGGDEFVVILEDMGADPIEAAEGTKTVCEKILLTLSLPYQLGINEHHSTPSIGATIFGNHEKSKEELLKQADIAMYQAKNDGRNTLRFFDPKMQDVIAKRAALEQEMRVALENHQFYLYYQIQVSNGKVPMGAETLIRWLHPERGLVPPDQFIPLAEDTGLILPIGQWVLETACGQLQTWQQNPHTCDLVLAVNVSAKQFRQPDFVAQVQDTLLRHDLKPSLLKLELTESLLVDNIEDTIATMGALSKIGVKISLDDFGTGYSSLQYLKRLPLDQLKIDQSFVRDLLLNHSDKAIVRTIIAMAQSLDLDVIAEGVETEEQRQFLFVSGCGNYQGYLFGRPMPIAQFDALLRQAA